MMAGLSKGLEEGLSKGLEEDRTTGFSQKELMEIYEAEDKEELRRALAMKEAMQGTPEDEMAAGIKAQKKKKKKKKTKASKKAGGGTVYRGRSYAYGGRVAKYKG